MTETPLLIVWHSRTGASEAAARAAAAGGGPSSRILHCNEARADDFLAARSFLFCGPENLAGLSGLMKEMLDRLYYPLLARIEGRAYASIITAGSDGTGAQRQLDRIVTGWRLRRVAEPVIINLDAQSPTAILAPKSLCGDSLAACRTLGASLAEGARLGVY